RRGDLAGSLEEFLAAASGHEAYFREALKLVWSESGESVDAVRAVTPDDPKDTLGLSRFLLEQSRPSESAAVFREVDRPAPLVEPGFHRPGNDAPGRRNQTTHVGPSRRALPAPVLR